MEKRIEFQVNKENLEELINRFNHDFGNDDIKLLEYFVLNTKENIITTEKLNKLKKYLKIKYSYDGDYDLVQTIIELLDYKTNSESGLVEHMSKMNKS